MNTEDTPNWDLSSGVIACAIEVHRTLGPGLLESTYQRCLSHELDLAGIENSCEVPLPIHYKGTDLECGYRLDIVISDTMLIELKSVKEIDPIHKAQMLTYLKLSGIRTGLLINFNAIKLIDGLTRFVF